MLNTHNHIQETSIYAGINSQSVRVVSVCPGEQLPLTCISNNSVSLRWAITIPERNVTHSRLVPYTGSRVLTPIRETLNHNVTVTFRFTRTSEDGTLPLISQLVLERATNHLHGTEIHCSSSETFLVHVQGSKMAYLNFVNTFSLCLLNAACMHAVILSS